MRTTVNKPSASCLLAIGIAVLALAGCGGGSSSESTTTATTVFKGPLAAPNGQAILNVPISTTEFAISPEFTRLSIPGVYNIDVTNDGTVPHALVIERDGVKAGSGEIAPGRTVDFKVNLSAPGVYHVYCPIDGHRAKGVKAQITMGDL